MPSPASPLRLPIGLDDFRMLREQGLAYVDKSHLIGEILDMGAQAILLPRPRRFGKTLNLSMLRYFFEKRTEDLSHLFEGLSIWQADEDYRAHFQRYPVIFLTFKGVKHQRFERCYRSIQDKIRAVFDQHRYLLDSGKLSPRQTREYQAILDGTARDEIYERALLDLSEHLHSVHGTRVILLLDEYDEPIHAGYTNGYAVAILDFFRAFLTEGLKGNPHLHKAVLTGILCVAKESIFSGLNNLAVCSLLDPEFNTAFGFTEPEVLGLLTRIARPEQLGVVRDWYNGYIFGGEVIYNPWSVLNFLARPDREPEPYWLSTSSNDLVRDLLRKYAASLEPAFESLLAGESFERVLDSHVALADLQRREDALYSLLVLSGYLKAERRSRGPSERAAHALSIPNREVRELYSSTFQGWLQDQLGGGSGGVALLKAALLGGDTAALEEQLSMFTTNMLSYHDTALRPEQVYQAFIIGLLASLEPEYLVRSNRESGFGRPDVLIRPREPGKAGVVLELKVVRPQGASPEDALVEGLAQIEEKGYTAELIAGGASPVHAFAVAFDGKRVWVRKAEEG